MRIWSLHPGYLDAKGLVACWRETLLAQKVLDGKTSGYRNHPQLRRFRLCADPLASIGVYLDGLEVEAAARGYKFNRALILHPRGGSLVPRMLVNDGQMDYEAEHLLAKLALRDPARCEVLASELAALRPHALFTVVPGGIEDWEVR